MSEFGGLVDAARKGNMSRRGFLAAALALGVGELEAAAELPRKVIISVPAAPKIGDLWWPGPLANPALLSAILGGSAGLFAVSKAWARYST